MNQMIENKKQKQKGKSHLSKTSISLIVKIYICDDRGDSRKAFVEATTVKYLYSA